MTILEEAAEKVAGEKAREYGPAGESFEFIALMWSALLGVSITRKQVAMCMIALKLQRLRVTPNHRDSMVDIAGYTLLMEAV